MNEDLYFVTVDKHTIAEKMTLDVALLLVEAIFQKFDKEVGMVVAVEREE